MTAVVRWFETELNTLGTGVGVGSKCNNHQCPKQYEEELESICREAKTRIDEASENEYTRMNNYGRCNTLVRRILGDEFWPVTVSILKPLASVKRAAIANQQSVFLERNTNRMEISGTTYQEAIKFLSKSEHYYELCACVILAIGRRPTEVSKTGYLSLCPVVDKKTNKMVSSAYQVLWGGQLKKRTRLRSSSTNNVSDAKVETAKRQPTETVEFPIPVLVLTPQELLDVFEKLRKMKDVSHLSNAEASSRTNAGMNAALRRVFETEAPSITCELVRGAYAYICYRLYSTNRVSEAVYGARLLGHGASYESPTDLQTVSQNYASCVVAGWPGAPLGIQALFQSLGESERNVTKFIQSVVDGV